MGLMCTDGQCAWPASSFKNLQTRYGQSKLIHFLESQETIIELSVHTST